MSKMGQIAFAFMVIGTIVSAIALIPLCWTIPMTVHYYKNNGHVGVGFKVCTILFVSLIAGILAICDD